MDKLKKIFADLANSAPKLADFEREPAGVSDGYVSPLVGDPAAIKWYRARRAFSYFAWDIYAGAAIKHYQTVNPNHGVPLMNEHGAFVGETPVQFREMLEREYLRCKEVPWRDQRPEGSAFNPLYDPDSYPAVRDQECAHREMSMDVEAVLNDILASISPLVEKILGHYWSAGAVRLFSHKPGQEARFHTDGWPLSLRKIMIYPSGAGPGKGSTAFFLKNDTVADVAGEKGAWALFENSTVRHKAVAPPPGGSPRPTIEIVITPAFKTDPKIKGSGIHVMYPWLPSDIDGLEGERVTNGFTSAEIKNRSLLRTLLLAMDLPDELNTSPLCKGLGYLDI